MKTKWSIFLALNFILHSFYFSSSAWPNNSHEHIFSYPKADEIFDPIEKYIDGNINGGPILVKSLIKTKKEFDQLLSFNLDFSQKDLLESNSYYNKTLKELLNFIQNKKKLTNNKEAFAQLMTLKSKQFGNAKHAKKSYVLIEMARGVLLNDIILKHDPVAVNDIYKAALENEHQEFISGGGSGKQEQFGVSYGSYVPDSKNGRIFLENFKKEAEKHYNEVIFFSSTLRSNIQRNSKPLKEDYFLRKLQSDLVGGIDITSSINEKNEQISRKSELTDQIKNKILNAFRAAKKSGKPVRIHAFENASQGPFYQAIQLALSTLNEENQEGATRPKIIIGHIKNLDQEWIKFLSSLKNLDIEINANVASSFTLQTAGHEKLQETVNLVRSHGLKVTLGSDGRGILLDAGYWNNKKALGEDDKPTVLVAQTEEVSAKVVEEKESVVLPTTPEVDCGKMVELPSLPEITPTITQVINPSIPVPSLKPGASVFKPAVRYGQGQANYGPVFVPVNPVVYYHPPLPVYVPRFHFVPGQYYGPSIITDENLVYYWNPFYGEYL